MPPAPKRKPTDDPTAADPDKNSSANCVENAEGREQHRHKDQQADQRWHAAARQHAIVDFEHEHRAGQHQHIAHAADDGRAVERAAARSERCREFRTNRKLASIRLATLH